MPMIKSPFNFFQIESKVTLVNSPILLKPVLGKRLESLNPIDVISSFGYSFNTVIPTNKKSGMSKPIICIIENPCLGISGYKRHYGFSIPERDRESQDFPYLSE